VEPKVDIGIGLLSGNIESADYGGGVIHKSVQERAEHYLEVCFLTCRSRLLGSPLWRIPGRIYIMEFSVKNDADTHCSSSAQMVWLAR
jgi:hypothetical protein